MQLLFKKMLAMLPLSTWFRREILDVAVSIDFYQVTATHQLKTLHLQGMYVLIAFSCVHVFMFTSKFVISAIQMNYMIIDLRFSSGLKFVLVEPSFFVSPVSLSVQQPTMVPGLLLLRIEIHFVFFFIKFCVEVFC